MQVEDVAGVRLASGRTTQRQRHLTIGDGLLGQVIVDDKHVTAGVGARAGRPSSPLYMKYSPMAAPAIGAMY